GRVSSRPGASPPHSILSSTGPAPLPSSPLPLHDALPISGPGRSDSDDPCLLGTRDRRAAEVAPGQRPSRVESSGPVTGRGHGGEDRKSTRLNSSHVSISYAVFCLKKKKHQTPLSGAQMPP